MIRKTVYFMVRALRNMKQSPYLCTAAISTVTVSLLILAFFALVVLNVEQLTNRWSKEVQVVAYLEQVPSTHELDSWIGRIHGFPEVESVNFISREEAFKRFQRRLGSDGDLLKGVGSDILPASLEIRIKPEFRSRSQVEALVEKLRHESKLGDLRYGQEWLERFEAFLSLLRLTGLILGGFLLFAALFIVSNTIKLTLFARRDELEVMSLVGGTPAFIKMPFLIEGGLQGALGGVLALGGIFFIYQLILREDLSHLLTASGLGTIRFLPPSLQLAVVLAGTLLGLFGSLFSLRRLVRA